MAGLQVHPQPALGQHLVFGAQHHQVAAQAGAVALLRKLVGLLCTGSGLVLQGLLALQRLQRGDGVSRLLGCVQHQAVVLGNGGIQFCLASAQLGAQAPAVKKRQAQCRGNTDLARARIEQPVQPHSIQAHKGRQVDVGVELAACHGHALGGSLDAPARSRYVGSAAQQVGAQRIGHRRALQRSQGRGMAFERIGCLACEHGQLAPRQCDLFIQRFDLRAGVGNRSLRLGQLHLAVQPSVQALAGQFELLLALRQGTFCHGALGAQACQADIAAGHQRSQLVGCRSGVGLRGAGLPQRGFKLCGVLAKKVGSPVQGGLNVARGIAVASNGGGNQPMGRVMLAIEVDAQSSLRAIGCFAHLGQRQGLRQAGAADGKAGIALQGLLNQGIERAVAQCVPPLGGRRACRPGRRQACRLGRGGGQRRVRRAGAGAGYQQQGRRQCSGQGGEVQQCALGGVACG